MRWHLWIFGSMRVMAIIGVPWALMIAVMDTVYFLRRSETGEVVKVWLAVVAFCAVFAASVVGSTYVIRRIKASIDGRSSSS